MLPLSLTIRHCNPQFDSYANSIEDNFKDMNEIPFKKHGPISALSWQREPLLIW